MQFKSHLTAQFRVIIFSFICQLHDTMMTIVILHWTKHDLSFKIYRFPYIVKEGYVILRNIVIFKNYFWSLSCLATL